MQIVSLTLPNCRINAYSPPSRTQACFLPSAPPSLQSFNRVISLRNEDFVKPANVKQGGEVPSSCIIHAQRQKLHLKFLKIWVPPVLAALVAFSPLFIPPVSFGEITNAQRGATLFRRACIGCHDTGGNIIQPGATLFLKDLQRNGVETEEEIYRLTYFGKGRMPGFGENCTPRGQCTFGARLKEDEIKLLAEFVKSQADLGWPNIENYGD